MREILSHREQEKYSLVRALQSGIPGSKSSFESEVSDSLRTANPDYSGLLGVLIPPEVLNLQSRALQSTTASAGGYTAGNKVEPLSDFIYPPSMALRYGQVNVLTGEFGASNGTVNYPRVSASDEGQWLTPGTVPSAPTTTFGDLTHEANRLCAYREVDGQLLNQAWEADTFLRRMVIKAVGAAIDRAAIAGTGNAQPLGFLYNAAVSTIAAGTNGAVPTVALLNQLEDAVFSSNTNDENERIYCITPKLRKNLKATLRGTSTNTNLLETVAGIDYLNGIRCVTTNFLPANLTKGSGTSLSAAIFGDWSQMVTTQWSPISIFVDPISAILNNRVRYIINCYVDTGPIQPSQFSKCVDFVAP